MFKHTQTILSQQEPFVELALKGLMHTKTRGLKGYVYNNKKNSKTTTTKKTCKGINFTQIVV